MIDNLEASKDFINQLWGFLDHEFFGAIIFAGLLYWYTKAREEYHFKNKIKSLMYDELIDNKEQLARLQETYSRNNIVSISKLKTSIFDSAVYAHLISEMDFDYAQRIFKVYANIKELNNILSDLWSYSAGVQASIGGNEQIVPYLKKSFRVLAETTQSQLDELIVSFKNSKNF